MATSPDRDRLDDAALARDAMALLSRYVQFDTTNPPGAELAAAHWLRDQIVARGVASEVTVFEPAAGRGLVMARIPGSEPLKPLVINHHIDVVAADPAAWTHPPFSGAIADGYVWGRGTLDTKNLGIIFLLALESLIKAGVRFRRPIVFLAVPDEETGGEHGMGWLVAHHAAEINPEWVWDEGGGGFKGYVWAGRHVRADRGREADPAGEADRHGQTGPCLDAASRTTRTSRCSRRWIEFCPARGRCAWARLLRPCSGRWRRRRSFRLQPSCRM